MISAPLRFSPAPKGATGFVRPPSRIRCLAAPPATVSPYEELGVRAGATAREIRAAYRRLARERHPDVAGAPAAAEFVRLHRAYATLSDPDTRARYDDRAAVMPAGAGGRWSRGSPGRPRRTWETDQCW